MTRRTQVMMLVVGIFASGCFGDPTGDATIESNTQPASCEVRVTGTGWEPCTGTKNCMELDVGPVAVNEMRQVNLRWCFSPDLERLTAGPWALRRMSRSRRMSSV